MSLPSMLADYQALREGGQTARLRVGPWHHSSQDLFRYSFQDALDWFGAHLLGGPAPSWSSVRIETMDGGGWRDLPQWPPAASIQRWHLQPHGALATAVPPAGEPSRYTYDPADPTPAVGGTSSSPANAGPKDNRELERRPDVLTYTSEPLLSALEITGPVTAELFVSSSRPHTDFFARLCDVDPKGTVGEHHRRADPADIGQSSASADTHRPVAERPPVPPRPPDPAPGLQRRPPPLCTEHRQRGTAGDSGDPLYSTAGCPPRPRTPLGGPSASRTPGIARRRPSRPMCATCTPSSAPTAGLRPSRAPATWACSYPPLAGGNAPWRRLSPGGARFQLLERRGVVAGDHLRGRRLTMFAEVLRLFVFARHAESTANTARAQQRPRPPRRADRARASAGARPRRATRQPAGQFVRRGQPRQFGVRRAGLGREPGEQFMDAGVLPVQVQAGPMIGEQPGSLDGLV